MKSTFTSPRPIYYISGNPHIGHAYTTVVADVLARTARTAGPAFFLTGTDEHGQKVANAAAPRERRRKRGATNSFRAGNRSSRRTTSSTTTSFARRSRATKPRCSAFSKSLRESGDIYLGKYEGWYCVHDETFWLESKLVNGSARRAGAKCSGSPKTIGSSGFPHTATG